MAQYITVWRQSKGNPLDCLLAHNRKRVLLFQGKQSKSRQRFVPVNRKVKDRLSHHFELLNGSVSVGEVRLKLLLAFLHISQLLPQSLFIFSHGRDLQKEKMKIKK